MSPATGTERLGRLILAAVAKLQGQASDNYRDVEGTKRNVAGQTPGLRTPVDGDDVLRQEPFPFS